MNNDQIALYLNDHPEFFNQYPELLARIQSIAPEDMPLRPVKTLNIADRIVKRAHADTQNMKNQLVNFMEISQANEKIQENLFAIDRIIMYSLNFSQMIGQLREEIITRFKIPGVQIILMDGDAHLMERCLKERLDKNAIDGLAICRYGNRLRLVRCRSQAYSPGGDEGGLRDLWRHSGIEHSIGSADPDHPARQPHRRHGPGQ